MSTLPSERPETSIISEYEVFVFRDVGAAVTVAANIICNSKLCIGDIGHVVVEHNETEEEEEMFLKVWCLCKLLNGILCFTWFIASVLQEACNECWQMIREQLIMDVMRQFQVSCNFMQFDIVST